MNSGCWLIVWFCCCIFLSSCCTDESKIEVYNNKTILPLEGTLREQTNTADALDCGEKCCDTICDIALFSKDAETNCFLYFCEGLCQENTINGTTMLVKKSAGFEHVKDPEQVEHVKDPEQVEMEEETHFSSSTIMSKGVVVSMLGVGMVCLCIVVGMFVMRWLEWSPRRKYNRIDFLMNDMDD